MRIDSHQHYWKLEQNDYGWITPEIPVLYRDFLPNDLKQHLEEFKIDKTIVVQAAPTLEETKFILSLAEKEETIAGVVGWLDLEDPLYKDHLQEFNKCSKFVGIRVMIQDMEDERIILTSPYIEAFSYFAELDLPVDLLVRSDQLDSLVTLLDRIPGLRGVIDHVAKPKIAEGIIEPWKSQMSEIAKNSNIYCKLSGMVTEADHHHWRKEDFFPYVEHILETFGVDRVMFGSDWPVCLMAAGYDEMYSILDYSLPKTLSDEERDKIFGKNAAAFYKLV